MKNFNNRAWTSAILIQASKNYILIAIFEFSNHKFRCSDFNSYIWSDQNIQINNL